MLIHMIDREFLRGSHDFLLSKQRSKIVIKENDIVIMNYNENEIPILWPLDAKNCWKRPWCWERLKAGGEGDDREWDGWMASLTRWTWVWASLRSWWWTGKPVILQSIGSQRVGYYWATELNWYMHITEGII